MEGVVQSDLGSLVTGRLHVDDATPVTLHAMWFPNGATYQKSEISALSADSQSAFTHFTRGGVNKCEIWPIILTFESPEFRNEETKTPV